MAEMSDLVACVSSFGLFRVAGEAHPDRADHADQVMRAKLKQEADDLGGSDAGVENFQRTL